MIFDAMDSIGQNRKPPRHFIAEWIEHKHLNSRQVAERMERSEATVSKLLAGQMKLTVEYLAEFAFALGLLADDGEPEIAKLFRDPAQPTRDELLRGYTNEELTAAIQLVQHSRNQASQASSEDVGSPDSKSPGRAARRAGTRGR